MILDEKKEKIELHKRVFECELENTYEFESKNGMTFIHGNKVGKKTEFNLLYDILIPSKFTKHSISYYYPILQGFKNTQKGRSRFKTFLILLDILCSSTIVIGILIKKLAPKKDSVMQWHTQADFTLPELNATKTVTWTFPVDQSTKHR